MLLPRRSLQVALTPGWPASGPPSARAAEIRKVTGSLSSSVVSCLLSIVVRCAARSARLCRGLLGRLREPVSRADSVGQGAVRVQPCDHQCKLAARSEGLDHLSAERTASAQYLSCQQIVNTTSYTLTGTFRIGNGQTAILHDQQRFSRSVLKPRFLQPLVQLDHSLSRMMCV